MSNLLIAEVDQNELSDFQADQEETSSERLEKMQKMLECSKRIAELRHILREGIKSQNKTNKVSKKTSE